MSTIKHDSLVKKRLDQGHTKKHVARKPDRHSRGHRNLVTLSEEEISRREHGWNDRFSIDPPPKSNKVHSSTYSPTFRTSSMTKESRISNERAQDGKRGGKRTRESKRLSSKRLVPLGALSKPSTEAAEPTKEEKLRFKVLKAIDARETLLYQLSALVLCTPTQDPLMLPARPIGPPSSTGAGRQLIQSRGRTTLLSTSSNRRGGNSVPMTTTREATKLAQQLSTSLQVAGIQCVEALVEWMLEAGAEAEAPPPFLWRGRNYFLKMVSDLDFAEAELQARGVSLDCFKQCNPLLINPNQKLGRALAAHSIIMEMVGFAKDMTPQELLALNGHIHESDCAEGEASDPKVEFHTRFGAAVSAMNGKSDSAVDFDAIKCSQDDSAIKQLSECHGSTAELVNLLDESFELAKPTASSEQEESEDYDESVKKVNDDNKKDGDDDNLARQSGEMSIVEDTRPVIGSDSEDGNEAHTDCLAFEKEEGCVPVNNDDDASVDGLDSVAEVSKTMAGYVDKVEDREHVNCNDNAEELSLEIERESIKEPQVDHEPPSSCTNASDRQSEYENSFDADEAGESDGSGDVQEAVPLDEQKSSNSDKSAVSEEDSQDAALEAVKNPHVEQSVLPEDALSSQGKSQSASEYGNNCDEGVDKRRSSNDLDDDGAKQIADSGDADELTATPELVQSIQETEQVEIGNGDMPQGADCPQTVSKRLVDELRRWASLEDESRPTEINARERLEWSNNCTLREDLQQCRAIRECMEGSLISMLEQYSLAVSEAPLENLLLSDVGRELNLATCLLEECLAVVGNICAVVTQALHHSLESKSSLVSEIEMDEVLKTAQAVRQGYHDSTWEYLKVASALSIFLHTSSTDELASMKSRAVVSSELSGLVRVFYPYLVSRPREELGDNWNSVSTLFAAMGLPIESLYLMLDPMCKTLLLAVNLCSQSSQDSQSNEELLVFPKVTIVCDRDNVLQSSVEYLWRTHLSSEAVSMNVSVSPFFKSSFGEKLVDGALVEEGEGKGPLKEWFGLIGAQLASKWERIPTRKLLSEMDSIQIIASGNTITIPGATEAICPGLQLEWAANEGETTRCVINKRVNDDTFLLDQMVPSNSFAASQLCISQPRAAIFEYVQGSERYWLNEHTRDSAETRKVLVFVGWVLASAMTHFSTIQLQIHPLFFRLLLHPQHCVTLEEIRLFDLQLFKSLSRMKDMKAADLAEYFKFEGADDSLSVDAYITKALEDKFGPESNVGWQLECVRRGFIRVIPIEQLGRVGIDEVDLLASVCGGSTDCDDFVINDVFRVAADTDFVGCEPLSKTFWRTVNGFEPQLKRKFLKFVTGVDTLPLAGTEFLRIEMPFIAVSATELNNCLQMLPQAHTCENTLELPHYWKALCWREQQNELEANSDLEEELALLLGKKLRDAVEYSSGYGLDSISAVSDVVVPKSVADDAELAKEESYDSLGLPALTEGQSATDIPTPMSPQIPDGAKQEQEQEQEREKAQEREGSDEAEVKPESLKPTDESYEEYDWEEEEVE